MNIFSRNHAAIRKLKDDNNEDGVKKTDFIFGADNENKPDYNFGDDEYFDFKKIFKQNRSNKKIPEDLLNREYPNEIDKILRMKDTNYLVDGNEDEKLTIKKQGTHAVTNINTAGGLTNATRVGHPALVKHPFHQADAIESYSILREKN